MSHFTVLVPAKDGHDLAARLAPFHEFECTGNDNEYVKDIDVTSETLAEYEQVKDDYDSFADFYVNYYSNDAIPFGDKPDLTGPQKYGYALLNKDGSVAKVIQRTNPNKRWDWWSIGGRWSGLLILTDGTHNDSAQVRTIDFKAMQQERVDNASKWWDDFAATIAYAKVTPEQYFAMDNDARRQVWDGAREFFFSQKKKIDDAYLNAACDGNPLAATKAEHLAIVAQQGLTFAFVDTDGIWHEKAEMRWWACTSNEQPQYGKDFWEFVANLPKDINLYVVDCHI